MPRNLCSRSDWLGFCGKNKKFANFTGLGDLTAFFTRLIELNYYRSEDEVFRLKNRDRFLIDPWMMSGIDIIMDAGSVPLGTRYSPGNPIEDNLKNEFCLAPKPIHDKAKILASSDYKPESTEEEIYKIALLMLDSYFDFKYLNTKHSGNEKLEEKWEDSLSQKWCKKSKFNLYSAERMLLIAEGIINDNMVLFEHDDINLKNGDLLAINAEVHRILAFVDPEKADKSFIQEFYWGDHGDLYYEPSEVFTTYVVSRKKFSIH